MPKTKFQEIIFTVLMVFVMVYVMICYNIALNIGGMQNHVFTDAFHELVIMAPIAFVLDFFFVGMIAKRTAFRHSYLPIIHSVCRVRTRCEHRGYFRKHRQPVPFHIHR